MNIFTAAACAACLFLTPALAAGTAPLTQSDLFPAAIPAWTPAQPELTAGLRAKGRRLGLNGLPGPGGKKISRALLYLPADRSQPGALTFEIEGGNRAGLYQCEALGRGTTYKEPAPGLARGLIDGTTIYYAPMTEKNGATIPGVYDLRVISPADYEIVFLGPQPDPAKEPSVIAATKGDGKPKPHFSAVWKHWYPPDSAARPVDMIWAEDSQDGTRGEGVPLFERRPSTATPEEAGRLAAQLAHDPGYYRGPYGRSGFAVHTDRWETEERRNAPEYAGRPELKDFRWRDTSGCVKLRPGCLELFDEFVAEQARLGRRPQLEVREVLRLPTAK